MRNIFLLILVFITFFSCQKEDNTNDPLPYNPINYSATYIRGQVLDNNLEPISGVSVRNGNRQTTTNNKGLFNLSITNYNTRETINLSKQGYFDASKAVLPIEDGSCYSLIIMDYMDLNSTFNSSSGTSLYLNSGTEINFPNNSYYDVNGNNYYGEVYVYVNEVSPNDENFTNRIPGGDLMAISSEGNEVSLYSYGMLDVVLKDQNEEPLSMDGIAQLTYPIPSSMLADAPENIPLWHYNEINATWEEEGVAIKSGSSYTGEVSHFSFWNFDVPGNPAGVDGYVYDCLGLPVHNLEVTVGQLSTQTNSDGYFSFFIPSNTPLEASIDFLGISASENIPATSASTVHNIGVINWCGSSINGTVVDCNGNPAPNRLVYSDYSPFTYSYTDINGNFNIYFPSNIGTTVYVESFFGEISDPINVEALTEGQEYNVGSIFSCEENVSPTTVAQDQQNITNSFVSMENCMSELKDGYGAEALSNFLNLDEGDMLSENWVDNMFDNLDDFLNLNSIDDDNMFDFNSNTGTYIWNESIQDWTKTLTPSDKIIIQFPSSETSNTNNAIFTFDNYEDANLFYDGENLYPPSSIHADLYVDGLQVFELTGSFSYAVGETTPIPVLINTEFVFNPFTFSITGNRVSPTEFNAGISFSNNNNCITSLSASIELSHDDYENIQESDIVSVNTELIHENMNIHGFIDGDIFSYDDPSSGQINAMTDMDVFYNGSKIGELILNPASNSDDQIYIIYQDGSSEDIETYYDPFLTNLEEILFPFIGSW